jgi:flagellar M-ring protein FliF
VDREVVGEGAGDGSGGLAGTVSNVTGLIQYPNASPGASPGASAAPDYVKESATINYANTQTVAQIVQAPGAVQRLSVAVLVDQDALTASGMSNEVLTAGIKAAVGAQTIEDFPDGRGDVIELAPAKFAVADEAALVGGPDIMGVVGDVVPTVGGGLLAVVLLFLVWRNMRALRGRAEDMQLLAARMGQPQLGPGEMAMAGAGAGYYEHDLPELAPMSSPQAKVQERIRLMAEDKPDELASLVTTWLHEDEKGRRR